MAPGAELDNANPTILSASELPTRQKRAAPRKGPDSKYADIIFAKPSYLSRPLYNDAAATAPSWPGADDGDYAVKDIGAEPIDEQEIYGTFVPPSAASFQVKICLADKMFCRPHLNNHRPRTPRLPWPALRH